MFELFDQYSLFLYHCIFKIKHPCSAINPQPLWNKQLARDCLPFMMFDEFVSCLGHEGLYVTI